MIEAQGADARLLERLHAQGMEVYARDTDPKDYETGRYGIILGMVRRGACYEEVCDYIEEAEGDRKRMDPGLYGVYVKIANGETSNLGVDQKPSRSGGACGRRRRMILELASLGFSSAEIAELAQCSLRMVYELVGIQK